MKDFNNSFLTIINDEEAIAFWAVDFQIESGTHQYYTTLDMDIVIDGDRYLSTEMSVSPVNYSTGMKVDKVNLDFGNVDLTMSAILLNYNVTGQPCIVYGGAIYGYGSYKNIILNSEAFDSWSNIQSTVSADATTDPDGDTTADEILANSTADASHAIYQSLSLTADTTYIYSCYLKKSDILWGALRIQTRDASYCTAYFDLNTGSVGSVTNCTSAIESVGDDWYLCSMIFDSGSAAGTPYAYIYLAYSSTVLSIPGDVDGQGIYSWGAQLLEGDELRPYVKTESTAETNSPITQILFRGLTSDWSLDEEKAAITIVDEFVYWNKRSLRKPDALCPWEFKGTECTYAGVQTACNKSYDRCTDLVNTDQFGGFRFFPAMEEKEIWWGKQS